MSDDNLDKVIVGYDLGIKRQVTGSDSTIYHIEDSALNTLTQLEAKRIRYQKRYSRMARANDKKANSKKRQRTKGEQKMALSIACRV
jgi:putative transposase